MSNDTDRETHEDFKARFELKQDWLQEHGFDRTVIHIGGGGFMAVFGGVTEAAMCLRCFAMVPIVDMTDATTSIQRHAEWHA